MVSTQPRPALEFYADSLHDRSLRPSSAPSCVGIEHALSKLNNDPILNQYLGRLYPTRSKKGETVIGICSNSIRLQEGFSAIGSLAQHERKFCALIIAFGLLTQQVGDQSITRALTFSRASKHLMVVLGQRSRFSLRPWRKIVFYKKNPWPTYEDDKFVISLGSLLLWDRGKSRTASYVYTKTLEEMKTWKPRAMRQFGNVFWEGVGSLALRMPEVDDFATQVGLMCTVLVDAYVLSSHSMSDPELNSWSQDIALRSFFLTASREVSMEEVICT